MFLETIASAIIFLATDIMVNSVPVQIMVSANAANVLAIQNGIVQVLVLLTMISDKIRYCLKTNFWSSEEFLTFASISGYTACECQASNDTCITPYGEFLNQLCSGHGRCQCGKCQCDETEEGQYSGQFCEDCPVRFYSFAETFRYVLQTIS